jgi:hypothetical protein
VRFSRENGCYKLCAEDDGHGFWFTGRLSAAELEASSRCPLVIKERVRALKGHAAFAIAVLAQLESSC